MFISFLIIIFPAFLIGAEVSYDLDAEHYTRHSSIQHSLANLLLKDHLFHKSDTVLDVGCGDGHITAMIAKDVAEGTVIGIDASESMIEYAQTTFPASLFPNLNFQLMNAEEVCFSEKFNAIVSFSCMHWVKDGKVVLSKLADLLSPDGNLLILAYPKESPYHHLIQETLNRYPEYVQDSAYHSMLTISDYYLALTQSGLDITTFEVKNMTASYSSNKEIKDFIRGWLHCFVPLPKELEESFLELAIKNSVNYQIDKKDSKIHLPYTLLLIKAKKPITLDQQQTVFSP